MRFIEVKARNEIKCQVNIDHIICIEENQIIGGSTLLLSNGSEIDTDITASQIANIINSNYR